MTLPAILRSLATDTRVLTLFFVFFSFQERDPAAEAADDAYQQLRHERANITSLRAVRGRGAGVDLKGADIKLECQVGINSPSSRGGTSVRG